MNDRGGEGSPIERTSLRTYVVVSASSAGVWNVREAKNMSLLVQNEECMCKMHLSIQGPLNKHYKKKKGFKLLFPTVYARVK